MNSCLNLFTENKNYDIFIVESFDFTESIELYNSNKNSEIFIFDINDVLSDKKDHLKIKVGDRISILSDVNSIINLKKIDVISVNYDKIDFLKKKELHEFIKDVKYIHIKRIDDIVNKDKFLYLTNFYKFEEVYKNVDDSNLHELVYINKFIGDPIFNYANLTLDEQVNIRGKPLKYLLHTMEIFESFTNHKIILEIGSIRGKMNHDIKDFNPWCCNDGHSTYFWKNYTNADIYTVDINEGCKNIIHNDVRLNGVNAITDDAINYAKIFDKKIDLLFLDAWDVIPSTPYAEKHLEIFYLLKDKLSEECLILIDDTDIDNGGKGKLLIPQLKKEGFIQIFNGRQSLFFRGKNTN